MFLAQASLNSSRNGSPTMLNPVLGVASIVVVVVGSGAAAADKPGDGTSRPSTSFLASLSASLAGDPFACA
ncbi:hypothetical protein SUGI_1015140 [Cryptomeria japonica]|nr:hypothetical protein SUGI_1015140 [Cryptomeria japonica]